MHCILPIQPNKVRDYLNFILSKVKKLTGKKAEIKNLLNKKVSKSAIARILCMHRLTVIEFVKEIQQKISSVTNRLTYNLK